MSSGRPREAFGSDFVRISEAFPSNAMRPRRPQKTGLQGSEAARQGGSEAEEQPSSSHRKHRKTACTSAGSPHVPENSLHHGGVTARTGKQLAPPRGHRTYRKTACTNAGPPQAQEPSWRSVSTTVFPDSAFRFSLGRFWAPGGDYRGGYLTRVTLFCGQFCSRLEV